MLVSMIMNIFTVLLTAATRAERGGQFADRAGGQSPAVLAKLGPDQQSYASQCWRWAHWRRRRRF